MYNDRDRWVFMSIFYSREKWHLLLEKLRLELFEQSGNGRYFESIFVFLSAHRGSNIRLALKSTDQAGDPYKPIENKINAFLLANPSADKPGRLPITNFFTDFPNNEIRFNLFNERVIMQDGLITFQLLLSKILTEFFKDHQVDDDGIFTLSVYLHDAILNGLCATAMRKRKLCLQIMEHLAGKANNLAGGNIQLKPGSVMKADKTQYLLSESDNLFKDFESATRMLFRCSGDVLTTYLTIARIVQLQLYNISGDIFSDTLQHIYESIHRETLKKPAKVIRDSHHY